jgi:D-3-phosphoglycerate dehydrogenase
MLAFARVRTVFVGVWPFAKQDAEPLRVLERTGAKITWNPHPRRLKASELPALVADAECWVAGTEPITRQVIEGAKKLRIIARVGVGLDSVDLEAAKERGVVVSWTPEAPASSVAELTIGLLIDLARGVTRADRSIRRGEWDRSIGFLIEGKTLGVLGCGRIGKRVARLARAFGMNVLAHDIAPDEAWARSLDVRYVARDELLAASDALTIHLPLTPRTRGLIGERELALLKPGALLLNTCRGEVLDEAALDRALPRLGGAALDVFCEEPYAGPLRRHENAVFTAHMGSCSAEGRRGMELGAALAVAAYLEGREIPERVV